MSAFMVVGGCVVKCIHFFCYQLTNRVWKETIFVVSLYR